MAPAVLLFDLDGTLVDSAMDIARALSAVRIERGGEAIRAQDVRPLVSQGAGILVKQALGAFAGDAAVDLAAFRSVLRGLKSDPSVVFPGVRHALADLAAAGHIMAIVTNKPEELSRTLLEQLGLADYFAAIVGGDTTPFSKPHRAPIERALALIGGSAKKTMFIGDSDVDARAAGAFRIPFLLYDGGYGADACGPEDIRGRFAHFDSLAALISDIVP